MNEFVAHRLSPGNLLFPVRLRVTADKVVVKKAGLFHDWEQSIPLSQVASISVRTGFNFSDVIIESTGGTENIVATGFARVQGASIRDTIELAKSSPRTFQS